MYTSRMTKTPYIRLVHVTSESIPITYSPNLLQEKEIIVYQVLLARVVLASTYLLPYYAY